MPLPLPNLDSRRWSDLVADGRALIPRYAPEWTDHNAHDPGVTLMELFAWLAEMDIYRLNQVPPRHRLKFLELVGFVPRPPRAARTMLSFAPTSGATITVPGGAQFETVAAVPFRTLRDLPVSPAPLKAILMDNGDGVLRDQTGEWLQGIPLPAFGAAFYLGFDTLPAGVNLALGVRVLSCNTSDAERRRILAEAEHQAAACRATLLDSSCPGAAPPTPPPVPILQHHSVRLAWEAYTGVWTAIAPVTDDTRALTLDGIVELPVPAAIAQIALGTPPLKPMFYLRCRLASGAYDRIPLLLDLAPNAVWAEQAVPAIATFQIAAGVVASGAAPTPGTAAAFDTLIDAQIDAGGVIQSLTFLAAGAARHPGIALLAFVPATPIVPGTLTLSLTRAGYSVGIPNQRMYLAGAPVQQESLQLYTHLNGAWQLWRRRTDLDASTRSDFDFVLDATSGALTFGDGEHGRVPPLGSSVLAMYRATLGDAGNLPAREITKVTTSLWNGALLPPATQAALAAITTNRMPASGGTPQEDLPSAAGRAVEVLHAHERLVELAQLHGSATLDQIDPAAVRAIHAPTRAVNLLDIERLALDTPGACLARAHAWAGVDAAYPCLHASGVVTVMIVPDLDTPKPLPSAGLIAAVQRHLDLRRIVCTRIVVAAPDYLTLTVTAKLGLSRGASGARVQQSVRQALDRFLDPRTGGPDGFGWPFGRDVFRSEILQVIQAVPGVDYVLDLSLQSDHGGPQCGNIAVCATWLVTPGAHRIETV